MKTWNNTDKSEWLDGPWKQEPDKAQWVHNDLDCLIVRGPSGALCGYVGVPKTHEYFEIDYSNIESVDIHGGLTFSEKCHPSKKGEAFGICHTEEGAANKEVWWLGFDCAHAWDICPAYHKMRVENGFICGDEVYRDFNYVKSQVESLADQFAA